VALTTRLVLDSGRLIRLISGFANDIMVAGLSQGESIMHTIQLELEEELAAKLVPYRDKLPEMLELGLEALQEREAQERQEARKRVLGVLGAAPQVNVPQPSNGGAQYVRLTPVQITGQPVSEIVIAERGAQ
jgi:hypothetical protein